jgi:hypothetical protein
MTMYRYMYAREFYLKIELLESHWVSDRRMEFVVFGDGPQYDITLTNLENRNQRPAKAEFATTRDVVQCVFESQMDFDKFECALESHGCRDVNPRRRSG